MAKSKVITANDIWDDPKDIFSVSPNVDIGLGGGIPLGSWVILSGKQKTGKTSLAIHMLAKFLSKYPDSKALYVDVEHRMKKMNLSHALIDQEMRDRIEVIKSTPDELLSAEEILNRTENWIKDNKQAIILIDSVSSLVGQAELAADVTGSFRSQGPRIMANFTRKMGPVLDVRNSVLITVLHLIANTSGYGAALYEDGGNKVQYQSDIKLRVKKSVDWEDENKKNIGKEIDWSVEWAALPGHGGIIKNYFRYGHGTDEIMESIYLAEQFGIVMKSASWYACDLFEGEDGKPLKFQGLPKFYAYFNENPDKFEILLTELKTYMT